MNEKLNSNQELNFPLICHYRIIALDIPEIALAINVCLKKFEIKTSLQKGNTSKKGKYLSFGIDITINSKEEMQKVNSELLKVEGVKMVL